MGWIDWGDAPGALSALAAIIAAWFAFVQMRNAQAAARDANAAACDAKDALASTLRPIVAFTPADDESIGLTVTGQHPAVDIVVRVTGDGGRVYGEGTADRIAGKVPGTLLGDADLVVPLPGLVVPTGEGESLNLTMTARFADARGLRRWEQRGQIRWEVRRRNPQSEPEIFPVWFDQGEPMPYTPADAGESPAG